MLNLLVESRLIALRRGIHVADHLHDISGVEIVLIAQCVILVLDQIVAGGKSGDAVAAGSLSAHGRGRQILGNFLRKSLGIRLGLQARRLIGRIA